MATLSKAALDEMDLVVEDAVNVVKPIILKLSQKGSKADCYALKAWGFLMQAAVSIDKAKELLK